MARRIVCRGKGREEKRFGFFVSLNRGIGLWKEADNAVTMRVEGQRPEEMK
jgi:hypothetical protein